MPISLHTAVILLISLNIDLTIYGFGAYLYMRPSQSEKLAYLNNKSLL